MVGRRGTAPVIRLLVDPGTLDEGRPTSLSVPDREAHHLRVRRARPGDPIELLDGAGATLRGTLAMVDGEFRVRSDGVVIRYVPPVPLILRVAGGDRDRFGWLMEKATELGVSLVTPLETERTRSVTSRLKPHHLPALQQRAREAAKQCGAPWVPVLDAITSLSHLGPTESGVRWLADPAGGPVSAVSAQGPVEVMIGPEGGFSEAEIESLQRAGAVPVRFGGGTLRFETAALASAVLVSTLRTGVTV